MGKKNNHKEFPYLDREISWIAFNERVLGQAMMTQKPLLERLRFIAIAAKNLDEFFMVRVAGLKNQEAAGLERRHPEPVSLKSLLDQIHERASALIQNQFNVLQTLKKELESENFFLVTAEGLMKSDKVWLSTYFKEEIFPVLTPLAVDPAHPFPFVANLGMTVALEMENPEGEILKGLVPLPLKIKRFIQLPNRGSRFIALEDVISLFIPKLFPGFILRGMGCFRVVRDSEVEIHEESDDFVHYFEAALKQRERGAVILLMIQKSMPPDLRAFVEEGLDLSIGEVMEVDGMLGLSDLDQVIISKRNDLQYKPYVERFPARIREFGGSCLAAIKHKDLLVHHPYESFDVVVDFLKEAARDPNVVSIKQTLYRTSNDSPIVAALIEAAENGKSVLVIVELKARFDEKANLKWARDLERAGVLVVYGLLGLKTHAKLSLVTRREDGHLKNYAHFGTGNYHPQTARVYDDLSLFTADHKIVEDLCKIFNYVTGSASPKKLKKLAYSPLSLRSTLIEHIRGERDFAKAGKPAIIWAKMNALVDHEIIDELCLASQDGVKIHLIVRGICCLSPELPGVSENIHVKSLVGRFLEHSRIVCFGNGHDLPSEHAKVFISSADWMPRNFDWRFESLVPIENHTVKSQILDQIMMAYLKDTANSWSLGADGNYTQINPEGEGFNAHHYFMRHQSLSGGGSMTHDLHLPHLTLEEPEILP
ncbi:Polyphosphate kinase [Candidatus Bealeia paramacronuclearis]|uniref:Polyphosphate kinase n=1 Tax=Candidatus Bealeia paramacronuclearis TaxID=1921001 RepID=A0ABZ2C4A1_9PROT|nr:Polyphosphate kinase [Candidatus Bealeia paramacronuclearis]